MPYSLYEASIGIKNSNGSVTVISCKDFGWPDHTARLLCQDFSNQKSVISLLKVGDLTKLDRPFDKKLKLKRGSAAKKIATIKKAKISNLGKYFYLFDPTGNTWQAWGPRGDELSLRKWQKA